AHPPAPPPAEVVLPASLLLFLSSRAGIPGPASERDGPGDSPSRKTHHAPPGTEPSSPGAALSATPADGRRLALRTPGVLMTSVRRHCASPRRSAQAPDPPSGAPRPAARGWWACAFYASCPKSPLSASPLPG